MEINQEMESQGDMNYLKRYVQSHPDNRMAWYLLGKQYMIEGKEAKANYCFLQSGSIYDAYERKQHPLAAEPEQMLKDWNRKRSRRFLALRTTTATLAVAAIWLAFSSGRTDKEAGPGQSDFTQQTPMAATVDGHIGNALKVVLVKPATTEAAMLGYALGALMQGSGSAKAGAGSDTETGTAEQGLAAMLQQQGKWRLWTGHARLLAQTNRQSDSRTAVALLDAKACDCKPDDSKGAFKTFTAWQQQQETQWTLSSAIAHYRERMQTWPAKLEDLVRPYPNNTLSGDTKAMKRLFVPLLQALKAKAAGGSSAVSGGAEQGGESDAGAQQAPASTAAGTTAASADSNTVGLPTEPLSIVVDKENHRLAVVSGDVIVRSYVVGLGGDKTPDGNFAITEKVRNPNGKDDGEFGSRGMTLSGTLYAIHGTSQPDSIGKDESHGCIRMQKQDVEELFDLVPLGTKVTIKSGVLPDAGSPAAKRFRLQPVQDETNPAVVYRWLD